MDYNKTRHRNGRKSRLRKKINYLFYQLKRNDIKQ